MNPTDSFDRCEIDLTLRYSETSYVSQLEKLVAKFGEQHRWLIKDSLQCIEKYRRTRMSIQFVATIAGVNGPVGENEQEAIVRLREYMESAIGKRHFHDSNPDLSEQQYQETLFQLYDRETEKDIKIEEVNDE